MIGYINNRVTAKKSIYTGTGAVTGGLSFRNLSHNCSSTENFVPEAGYQDIKNSNYEIENKAVAAVNEPDSVCKLF